MKVYEKATLICKIQHHPEESVSEGRHLTETSGVRRSELISRNTDRKVLWIREQGAWFGPGTGMRPPFLESNG